MQNQEDIQVQDIAEEEYVPEQEVSLQQEDPPSKRRALFDALSKKFDLGTYDEYDKKLNDPAKRKALYEAGSQHFDLGTYDEYEGKLGIEKKNPSGTASNTSSVGASNGTISTDKVGSPADLKTDNTQLISDYTDIDPFDASQASNKMRNKTKEINNDDLRNNAAISKLVPDGDAINTADKIDSELEGKGFKKDFRDVVVGMDENNFKKIDPTKTVEENKAFLADKYIKNPVKFHQIINENKIATDIKLAAQEQGNTDEEKNYNGIIAANSFTLGQERNPHSWDEFDATMLKKQKSIDTFLSGDKRDLAQQRLKDAYQSSFSPDNTLLQEDYSKSDLKDKVDVNQYAALKSLEVFDKPKYETAIAILNSKKPTEYELSQGLNFDGNGFTFGQTSEQETDESVKYKKGLEKIKKELSEIGRRNLESSATSKIYENRQRVAQTPEELAALQQEENKNKALLQGIKEDASKDDERYPLLAQLKLDDQVKDLRDKAGMNPLEYGLYKFVKGFSNSGNSLGNIATNIFGNDNDIAVNAAQAIGENATDKSTEYLPPSMQQTQPQVIYQFSKELKKEAKSIMDNENYSWQTKDEMLHDLAERNKNKIPIITNPNAGKEANFWSKATLYSNAGTIGDIASIAAQSALLGAAGAGHLVSASIPMFTTTKDGFFKEGLEQGMSIGDANSYSNTHATIMMAAGLINPDLNILKRSIGIQTAFGKTIAGIDQKTWDAVLSKNKPLLQRIQNSAISVAKEAGKMGAVYGAGTSVTGDVADNLLYGKHNSFGDIVDHAAQATKNIVLSSVALLGVNAISNFKSVSPDQKASIWEAGTNKDITLHQIDDQVKSGELNLSTAEQYKKVVKNISELIQKVPSEDAKGKPLSDQDRVDYLYNLLTEKKAKEISQDFPPKQKTSIDEEALKSAHRNDIILSKPTDKQLDDRAILIEKMLTPSKDLTVTLPEKQKADYEAELAAIKEVQDDRMREEIKNLTADDHIYARTKNYEQDLNSDDPAVKANAEIKIQQLKENPIAYFEAEKADVIRNNPNGDNTKAIADYDKIIKEIKDGKNTTGKAADIVQGDELKPEEQKNQDGVPGGVGEVVNGDAKTAATLPIKEVKFTPFTEIENAGDGKDVGDKVTMKDGTIGTVVSVEKGGLKIEKEGSGVLGDVKEGRKPVGDGKFVRYNPDDVLPLLKDFTPTNTLEVENYVTETTPNDASVEAYKVVPTDAIQTSENITTKDRAAIDKIKEGIKNGDDIPPVVLDFSPVVKNGDNYRFGIMDGHHRYIAYKELGVKEIPAAIVTSRDHYTFETNDTDINTLFQSKSSPESKQPLQTKENNPTDTKENVATDIEAEHAERIHAASKAEVVLNTIQPEGKKSITQTIADRTKASNGKSKSRKISENVALHKKIILQLEALNKFIKC